MVIQWLRIEILSFRQMDELSFDGLSMVNILVMNNFQIIFHVLFKLFLGSYFLIAIFH
jgi:hypothetical protein